MRVQQLKTLLKEGADERQALRAKLKNLESAVATAQPVPPGDKPASDSASASDSDSDLEEPHSVAGVVPLRIPCLDAEQLKELRVLNPELATRAVQRLGELASGDPGAWRQVKRLKKRHSLLSLRLGIHHRMLFSTTSSEVRLVGVIHRKDLERALDRR